MKSSYWRKVKRDYQRARERQNSGKSKPIRLRDETRHRKACKQRAEEWIDIEEIPGPRDQEEDSLTERLKEKIL